MRRRQRLNVTVKKYAPKWYAILKWAHDLELANDVGPTHDVSLTNMFFFFSNQKASLCHGINCGSYKTGTLAVAVHWEMNAIAPCGFIVEECSRGVNIH